MHPVTAGHVFYNILTTSFFDQLRQDLRRPVQPLLFDVGVNVPRGRDIGVTKLLLGQFQIAGLTVDQRRRQMPERVTAGRSLDDRNLCGPVSGVDSALAERVRIDWCSVRLGEDLVPRLFELRSIPVLQEHANLHDLCQSVFGRFPPFQTGRKLKSSLGLELDSEKCLHS